MTNPELADAIAALLFTNGMGEVADRLQMRQEHPGTAVLKKDLGGWCREAVARQVLGLLDLHRPETPAR